MSTPRRHPRPPLALLLALTLLCPVFIAAPPARADTCVVTNPADATPAPAGSLREKLADAGCDPISFALPGTGPWTINLVSQLPVITRNLTITGPGRDLLTLDGGDAVRPLAIAGGIVTISNLTVARGQVTQADGGGAYGACAAIIVGTVTLRDIAVRDCHAIGQGGGGLLIAGGAVTLERAEVRDNSADKELSVGGGGGGIWVNQFNGPTTLTIRDSVIAGNHADNGSNGGGIKAVSDYQRPGGGAPAYALTIAIERSTIGGAAPADANTATTGGGLYNGGGGGTLTLTDSTVAGNQAESGAGLFHGNGSTLVMTGTTVSGNQAAFGGGIYSVGEATLTNTTISGNRAGYRGGGFFHDAATATLRFVTVTGNVADSYGSGTGSGGGFYDDEGTITLQSSIVVGNRRGAATADDCDYGIDSAGHNLWGTQAPCPVKVDLGDQNLVDLGMGVTQTLDPALAANGGPTRTHALPPGSPAIDHGDTATCPVPIGTDQRNFPRNDGHCDVGAVEYAPPPSPSSSPSPSASPSPSPSPCGQRFGDVPAGDPACVAIEALAARGVIKGCDQAAVPPLFCPTAPTLRAQMAALIVRAMAWGSETPNNPFSDQCDPANPANCVDDELWNAVGVLAAKEVARGYTDGATCAPATAPCYAARDNVLYAQTISFITRAMVKKGYWTQATTDNGTVYPNIPPGSGHRLDFVTYTQNVGPVPGTSSATQDFAAWDQSSTRAWFAQALWLALQGH